MKKSLSISPLDMFRQNHPLLYGGDPRNPKLQETTEEENTNIRSFGKKRLALFMEVVASQKGSWILNHMRIARPIFNITFDPEYLVASLAYLNSELDDLEKTIEESDSVWNVLVDGASMIRNALDPDIGCMNHEDVAEALVADPFFRMFLLETPV